jgi:hypothetical protein
MGWGPKALTRSRPRGAHRNMWKLMEPYPIANGEALKAIVALRLPLRLLPGWRI